MSATWDGDTGVWDPTLLDDARKLAIVAYILANHGAMPRTSEVTTADLATIPIR